ncbi:MurE-like ligase [Bythopirellula polymerisocia]|uniref:MurE-like ligase n=2 Tax=Bythopirellula polymerisocia TaxID=2528003 RepID=A0A5C6CMK2_9BACT|nr:MurE-like ligase [Bythopirellula polymerisocia]
MHATRLITANTCGTVELDRLLPDATRTGEGKVFANSCTSDWQQVEPGDVYVALPELAGSEENGHRSVLEAVARGAIAMICEEPVPVFDVPTYLVNDSRVAFGKLCQALASQPSQSIAVVAVTGTHGKSTVIALLDSIFAMAGKHCGKISGLGCYDGMSHSTGIELPAAPELAARLERMVAVGCTHAFVEVSSEALSNASYAGIEFDAVCVTNVSDAHLDLHNSVQSYRNLKKSILKHLAPAGMVTLNADDPVSIKWLNHVDGPSLTFGTKGQAEITGELIAEYSNEQEFTISAGSQSAALRTTMIGEHHLSNCLAAATIALSYGIDLQTIAAGIEAVENLPGRMERVDCGQGFPVFVDAADTAESLRASLRSARHLSTGRVICVLGDPRSATYSEQLAVAHVVSRMADVAIIARSFPAEEMSVCDSHQRARVEVVDDRRKAIACALAVAQPGDVVVIAGSRWEPQRAYGSFAPKSEQGDAATARRVLYARTEQVPLRLVA